MQLFLAGNVIIQVEKFWITVDVRNYIFSSLLSLEKQIFKLKNFILIFKYIKEADHL